ncbi:N-acetylmuramic acid 6-phosphate etherase [Deinococcus sedimenti]|uniref:N-acetylmuramic acid 6-phosphate etherase n=1 Tax=Deinococcus sedimenti TaxID=1867090 RepID=A0ABQ2S5N4_9DEIO|nr:N-acetylmuramic acid 6-phosphate etherase [Deinococcus sedimenti]GGR91759.1 N-acetylmuramic acid 6-phosphate etherase [Deinococcus sedimenti]
MTQPNPSHPPDPGSPELSAPTGPTPDAGLPAPTTLKTESLHAAHPDLDLLSPLDLTTALLDDQWTAVDAARRAAPALSAAAEAALPRLQRGGRLLYAGAGTSGRLGVLDATELTPTFSWPPERAVPLIAGGERAIRQAVEGAEDDHAAGHAVLLAATPGPHDVLIAVAASGTTPWVLGAMSAARTAGALIIGLANNPGTPLLTGADCPVLLDTGPELISGSTRLKAGTAQKIALNTLSSALMVQLGKVYGNLMVDLKATNAKLEMRAVRLVQHGAHCDDHQARAALRDAGGHVKTAIVALRLGVTAADARARLDAADGHARAALDRP